MLRLRHGRSGPAVAARRRLSLPGVEQMEPRILLATWTVQSLGDDGATGTLRWAINQVNSASAPGTIDFDLSGSGVQLITLAGPLPEITNSVVIDGTSQPGYVASDLIQLDGSKAGANCNGLVLVGWGRVWSKG